MKKYDTIYLDWDGVLWDFKQAFCDWLHYDVPDTDNWDFFTGLGLSPQEFQKLVSGLPRAFWQQTKYLMPHAHKLVEWAKAHAENVSILTVAPEYDCSRGKENLSKTYFGLGIYAVANAEEKTEFAKDGALLIDDKPSSVVRFANETSLSGGYIWPAEYNDGLDPSWYFDLSWLEEPTVIRKSRIGVSAEEIAKNFEKACGNIAKGLGVSKPEKAEEPTVDSKPVLDYDAMDEAKKRKMTPLYSGLLAYFPDALAMVAQNSVIGQHQHGTLDEPLHWDRSKSSDDPDAMLRHMADHSRNPYDTDGRLHLGKVAWRALAMLQKFIEEENQCG